MNVKRFQSNFGRMRLLPEAILLLGAVGEIELVPDPSGSPWLLAGTVALVALSMQDRPGVQLSSITLFGLAAFTAGMWREVGLFGLFLLPISWMPASGSALYLAATLVFHYKAELLATLLPAGSGFHFGNATFIVEGALYVAARTMRCGLLPAVFKLCLVIGVTVLVGVLVELGSRDAAVSPALWSFTPWRVLVVTVVILPFVTRAFPEERAELLRVFGFLLVGLFVGALLARTTKVEVPVTLFDDAHGPWERTSTELNLHEWGRDTLYNYGLFFRSLPRLGLDVRAATTQAELLAAMAELPKHSALVLKTPMVAYSVEFVDQVRDWVRSGGFAVLISDHTDLFGMSQRLNNVLPRGRAKFDTTATFGKHGGLTRPTTTLLETALGYPASPSKRRLFQTGTSISPGSVLALNTLSYGLSYAEPADYSAQNRFGSFRPSNRYAFRNHAASLYVPEEPTGGAWLLIGDSTPWSNFSVFLPGYLTWWDGVIALAQFRTAWYVVAIVVLSLVFLIPALAIRPSNVLAGSILTLVGIVLGVGSVSHIATLASPPVGNIGWHAGSTAVTEFLDSLTPRTALNYSHLFSALPRFKRYPLAGSQVAPNRDLGEAILLHPDREVVDAREWGRYVRDGGYLVLIDDPINDNLAASRAILLELDIELELSTRPVAVSPGVVRNEQYSWTRVVTYFLRPRRPTTVVGWRSGNWTRLRVGQGEVVTNLAGLSVGDASIGDVWVGKEPSVEARECYAALAEVFHVSQESVHAMRLPRIVADGDVDYRLLGSDPGVGEKGSVNCGSREENETITAGFACESLDWLLKDVNEAWGLVGDEVWETRTAVRLHNGQSYLVRVDASSETHVWAEFLHDGAWGDDPTHRLIVKLPH